MSLNRIATLIPPEYRKEILETNAITEATATPASTAMVYLFTVWKNHVEPSADLDLTCGSCLSRILKNYHQLQPVLVDLEKQGRKLNSL